MVWCIDAHRSLCPKICYIHSMLPCPGASGPKGGCNSELPIIRKVPVISYVILDLLAIFPNVADSWLHHAEFLSNISLRHSVLQLTNDLQLFLESDKRALALLTNTLVRVSAMTANQQQHFWGTSIWHASHAHAHVQANQYLSHDNGPQKLPGGGECLDPGSLNKGALTVHAWL